MACIKTGAQVYLAQYGRYMICDIHEFLTKTWVLRGTAQSMEPFRPKIHATINKVAQDWQPEGGVSTMVVENIDYVYYGYDGLPILSSEFKESL